MLQVPAKHLQFLLEITHVHRGIVGGLVRGIWEGNRVPEVAAYTDGQHAALSNSHVAFHRRGNRGPKRQRGPEVTET